MTRPMGDHLDLVEMAAADLRADSRVFTSGNLFHAARRAALRLGKPFEGDFKSFRSGPLAARVRRSALDGLLPDGPELNRSARLPREWDAYFPACILVVDRAELVPLFAASGVVVQARMAVITLDDRPAHIVDWLRRGIRAGHRAPVGYLHEAATVVYPFASELLGTWARLRRPREELVFRDLGLPPLGLSGDRFGLSGAPVLELEEPPPHALIAYAARATLSLLAPDPMLFPLTSRRPRDRNRPLGGCP